MTELLKQAVKAAQELPANIQDEIARIVLTLAGDEGHVIQLTDAEAASFARSRAEALRRDFAPEDDVRAVWAKRGL